jgi:ABC-2 type transport system ATP-binding protein
MSIHVEGLTKIYGQQKAVDHISFSTDKGVCGFLGPNGAGKSTTMKMLTCFIPATEGKATVNGYDIALQPLEVRRHIGYLPESNPLYQDMYVKEALSFIAGIHQLREPQKRINEVIEQTGLGPEQYKKIHQLSKGYRQRVGLAKAILHDPGVLILDEPTSGLDPNQLIGIRQLIRDLGKSKTVVLSTHIMQEVEAVCSQIIIINKGKIVADDTILGLTQRYNESSLENVFIRLTN